MIPIYEEKSNAISATDFHTAQELIDYIFSLPDGDYELQISEKWLHKLSREGGKSKW